MAILTVRSGSNVFYVNDGIEATTVQQMKADIVELVESENMEEKVDSFFKKFAVPASALIGSLSASTYAFANEVVEKAGLESIGDKLKPLLEIVQDLALPIGIVVASWGLIEIIMGNFPGGKEKIKYALIGFVGMFLIPEVFFTIRDAFKMT